MMLEFNDLQSLQDTLISNGIDTSRWGSGSAKSINDLWIEINSGDSYLQDNPLLRVVQVVQVIIRRGSLVLVEIEQEFKDGRKRKRNSPPSEKVKKNRTLTETAINCLESEFNLLRADFSFVEVPYKTIQKMDASISYPGLKSKYIVHMVEAKVSGLPTASFWTEETESNSPVRRHQWNWKEEGTNFKAIDGISY